jgi:hypothetical protein
VSAWQFKPKTAGPPGDLLPATRSATRSVEGMDTLSAAVDAGISAVRSAAADVTEDGDVTTIYDPDAVAVTGGDTAAN